MNKLFKWLLLFSLLAAGSLLAGCPGEDREARLPTSVREEPAAPPVIEPAAELVLTQEAFIEVSEKVTPAVVNIRAARLRPANRFGPLFEEFFGELFPERPRRQEQSLGSGLLISTDGYILTNAHVVEGAEELRIKLSDRREYPGKLVGSDPRTDVAVVKIDADAELPAAVLGDSDRLRPGQWALAIGNPFGLDRTLTVGVVSAIGRANVGIEDYEDFIQTDASINPGNSGGPLLNIYGEVIGINTAIVAAGQGIGFAIPINLARLIADQLIERGEVTRGWLGVSIQPMTPELAESFGLERPVGALVNQVLPDTPAARAGVERGDVLLALDGREIKGPRQLQLLVASSPAGQTVELEILRHGRRLTLPVTLSAQEKAAVPGGAAESRHLGLTVEPPVDGSGVQVTGVAPESGAARAGIRPGDRILALNQISLESVDDFREAAEKIRPGQNVVVLLQRGDTTLYVAFPAS